MKQIKLWLEVQTGIELDGEAGDIKALSADEWGERRAKLEQRGEPT